MVYGTGPIVSTVLDVIRWQESLEQHLIISPSSYTEMTTFVNTFSSNYKSGLGLNKWKNLPFTILGHSGQIFNNSSMRLIEELGIYVAYNVTDNTFI